VSLLSESRKYGLGVHITNQYLSQLPEAVRDSVLGNVGTLMAFEVGMEDATILAKEFEPLTPADFMNLRRFNFYIRLMIEGKTSHAFSGVGLPPAPKAPSGAVQNDIENLNRLAYGYPRLLIEEKVGRYLR
jgi:hypothetical protein